MKKKDYQNRNRSWEKVMEAIREVWGSQMQSQLLVHRLLSRGKTPLYIQSRKQK